MQYGLIYPLQRMTQASEYARRSVYIGLLQSRIAGPRKHPHPDRDRLRLILGEHQRWQVEAAPEHIADPGRPSIGTRRACSVATSR